MTRPAPLSSRSSLWQSATVLVSGYVRNSGPALIGLVVNPIQRRRRRKARIALDAEVMREILPALIAYERRLAGTDAAPNFPPFPLEEGQEPRFEHDPNADLLAQIEHAALGVRALDNWELRDMLVSVVLSDQFRNEYFVRCLVHRVTDCVEAK